MWWSFPLVVSSYRVLSISAVSRSVVSAFVAISVSVVSMSVVSGWQRFKQRFVCQYVSCQGICRVKRFIGPHDLVHQYVSCRAFSSVDLDALAHQYVSCQCLAFHQSGCFGSSVCQLSAFGSVYLTVLNVVLNCFSLCFVSVLNPKAAPQSQRISLRKVMVQLLYCNN